MFGFISEVFNQINENCCTNRKEQVPKGTLPQRKLLLDPRSDIFNDADFFLNTAEVNNRRNLSSDGPVENQDISLVQFQDLPNFKDMSLKDYYRRDLLDDQELSSNNPNKKDKRAVKMWTKEEDDMLVAYHKQYKGKWNQIAQHIPDRNASQCSQRWRRIKPDKMRKPWTDQEDRFVVTLIEEHGKNWGFIAQKMENRTGKQVRERWINKLDPSIKKTPWTPEEDRQLVDLFLKIGAKWCEISKNMEGRPENVVKNRFYSNIRKNFVEVQTGGESQSNIDIGEDGEYDQGSSNLSSMNKVSSSIQYENQIISNQASSMNNNQANNNQVNNNQVNININNDNVYAEDISMKQEEETLKIEEEHANYNNNNFGNSNVMNNNSSHLNTNSNIFNAHINNNSSLNNNLNNLIISNNNSLSHSTNAATLHQEGPKRNTLNNNNNIPKQITGSQLHLLQPEQQQSLDQQQLTHSSYFENGNQSQVNADDKVGQPNGSHMVTRMIEDQNRMETNGSAVSMENLHEDLNGNLVIGKKFDLLSDGSLSEGKFKNLSRSFHESDGGMKIENMFTNFYKMLSEVQPEDLSIYSPQLQNIKQKIEERFNFNQQELLKAKMSNGSQEQNGVYEKQNGANYNGLNNGVNNGNGNGNHDDQQQQSQFGGY